MEPRLHDVFDLALTHQSKWLSMSLHFSIRLLPSLVVTDRALSHPGTYSWVSFVRVWQLWDESLLFLRAKEQSNLASLLEGS